MKRKIILLLALAMTLCVGPISVVYADHGKCFMGTHVAKAISKLDLTADQKTKIKAIRDKAKQDLAPLHKQMMVTHQQIEELFKAAKIDDSKFDSLINDKKELIGSIIKIRMNERRDISNVLTEQQKQKLATMMQQWKTKHKEESQD